MFLSAKVQNAEGELLDLMTRDSLAKFVCSGIQGLNQPPATLNMNHIVGMDGARHNSGYLNTRNLVVTFMLRGDQEESRQELYRYFRTNDLCRFFFQNRNRNVFLDGYVETVECDMFQRQEEAQVSIICPDPFLKDVEETVVELQNSRGEFTFPFAIDQDDPVKLGSTEDNRTTDVINDALTETPFEIEITAREVLSSFSGFYIQNQLTGEKIGFSGWPTALETFDPGDVIYINTDPEHPTMKIRRGTQVFNRIPNMYPGGTFFQLHPGSNVFGVKTYPSGDADKVNIELKFRKLYRGV